MKKNSLKHLDLNWIKVITGPMFSSKTTELLKTLNKYSYADLKSVVFLPNFDTRDKEKLLSRDGYVSDVIRINKSTEILDYLKEHKDVLIIAIDELQFLEEDAYRTFIEIAKQNKIVICAGLDTNWKKEPFNTTKNVLAIADEVIKLCAVCKVCGAKATKTYKKVPNDNILSIGDANEYEARCNTCFEER